MYLDYFDKFLNMDPYLFIDEREWDYIKQTFEKQDVRESLAQVAMTYPPPYMDITENDAYKELQKLKKNGVIVSSGAIALGCKKLQLNKKTLKIDKSQAVASI